MMSKIECRVFKLDVGWGYGLFHFPMEIEGISVKNNPRTKQITKKDFKGVFEFDKEYLEIMESDIMDDNKYYFLYYMING